MWAQRAVQCACFVAFLSLAAGASEVYSTTQGTTMEHGVCHDNFPGNKPTAHGSAGDLPAWLERKNATETSFTSTASLADAPADLQPKAAASSFQHPGPSIDTSSQMCSASATLPFPTASSSAVNTSTQMPPGLVRGTPIAHPPSLPNNTIPPIDVTLTLPRNSSAAEGAQDKPTAAPLIQPPAPAVKEEPNQTTLQPSIKDVRRAEQDSFRTLQSIHSTSSLLTPTHAVGSESWNGSAWFLWVFFLCACIPRKLRSILHKTGRLLHGMHSWYLARINARSRDHRWKVTTFFAYLIIMALIAGHAMHSETHPMGQSLGPLAWPLGWLCFASAALFAYITCCLALGSVSVPAQRQLTAATMAAQAAAFPASHPVLGDRSTAQRRSGAQSAQPAPSSADAAGDSRSFVQSEAQSAAASANCSVRPVHESFICACGYTFEVMSPEEFAADCAALERDALERAAAEHTVMGEEKRPIRTGLGKVGRGIKKMGSGLRSKAGALRKPSITFGSPRPNGI